MCWSRTFPRLFGQLGTPPNKGAEEETSVPQDVSNPPAKCIKRRFGRLKPFEARLHLVCPKTKMCLSDKMIGKNRREKGRRVKEKYVKSIVKLGPRGVNPFSFDKQKMWGAGLHESMVVQQ